MSRSKNHKKYNHPNVWAMLRDVLIASINRGQFLTAIVGLIILVTLIRLPQEELSNLVFEVLELFKSLYLIGWALFFAAIAGWYFNAKSLRKMHSNEMNRMASEKKDLQEKLIGKMKTSNR